MGKDRRDGSTAGVQIVKAQRRRLRVNVGKPWDDIAVQDERGRETRLKVAERLVVGVVALAGVALLILLVRGEKGTQEQIFKLCDHVLTGALGAGLGLLFGGGRAR